MVRSNVVCFRGEEKKKCEEEKEVEGENRELEEVKEEEEQEEEVEEEDILVLLDLNYFSNQLLNGSD